MRRTSVDRISDTGIYASVSDEKGRGKVEGEGRGGRGKRKELLNSAILFWLRFI